MNKNKKMEIISMIISGVLGGIVGFFGASYLFQKGIGGVDWIYIFLAGFIGFYIQLILHEVGHLLFGLYSGYKFVSFRIANFILYKKQGKIHLGKYSLPGTGGQCLMVPPNMKDGMFPYQLYNLGGVIMNVIVAEVAAILFAYLNTGLFGGALLLSISAFGLLFALTNGIPMRMSGIDNDGYNARSLGKNPEALRAFWLQLKINEMITGGMRLKDMPAEWFEKPSDEAMKNNMVAAIAYMRCERLLDEKALDEASREIEEMLNSENGTVGVQKMALQAELIFCEILGERREEILKKMEEKDYAKFMKIMAKYPSIIRTKYAYALLIKEDENEANAWKAQFEKVAKNYPYQGELENERELIRCCETYTK